MCVTDSRKKLDNSPSPPETGIENRELIVFVILSYAIGFISQVPALLGNVQGAGRVWLGLTMWAPTLAALLSGRRSRLRIWHYFKRGAFRYWPAALIAGWAIYLLQTLALLAYGGTWNQGTFEADAARHIIVGVHGSAMLFGTGEQGLGMFALNYLATLSVASLLFTPIGALGEELGWRALLHGELRRRFGPLWGTGLLSLIWAYWHLPANLMGYNDAVHPILNSFIFFPILTLALSFALGWLTDRSRSVWPAALAHNASNTVTMQSPGHTGEIIATLTAPAWP